TDHPSLCASITQPSRWAPLFMPLLVLIRALLCPCHATSITLSLPHTQTHTQTHTHTHTHTQTRTRTRTRTHTHIITPPKHICTSRHGGQKISMFSERSVRR